MANLFWQRVQGLTSGQLLFQPDQTMCIWQFVGYVRFNAGTSAGSVVLEGADDESYGGTWANLATVNWAAASRVHLVAAQGVHRALRLRIVSVSGGTIDLSGGGSN